MITGEFAGELQGSHVQLPFAVPAGTTAVRVKYCHDQPEASTERHTLDLGLYEARRDEDRSWGLDEFRGWGGSSHPDVTLSPEGFTSDAIYRDDPHAHVRGKTSRAFLPGPIPAGHWAVELGVAAVVPLTGGDADGAVAWRVEIAFATDPRFADQPYRPAAYDSTPPARAPLDVPRPGQSGADRRRDHHGLRRRASRGSHQARRASRSHVCQGLRRRSA